MNRQADIVKILALSVLSSLPGLAVFLLLATLPGIERRLLVNGFVTGAVMWGAGTLLFLAFHLLGTDEDGHERGPSGLVMAAGAIVVSAITIFVTAAIR